MVKKVRKTEKDKLSSFGIRAERYIESLYDDNEAKKIILDSYKEIQSFLQIPFSEGKFLEFLVSFLKPKKILEIGTFRGLSAYFLANCLPKDTKCISVDIDFRAETAKKLWKELGVIKKIDFVCEEGLVFLEKAIKNKEKFDFIFIDANKNNIKDYTNLCLKILNENGLLVIDNSLWNLEVTKENPGSNGSMNMKNFNEYIFKKYPKKVCMIPGWDGVILLRK